MSTSESSNFDNPLPFSISGRSAQSKPKQEDSQCDFITLLGVAQSLGIGFLPIRWRPNEGDIGLGGTGQISQSVVDIQTSLAFKRVSSRYKREDSEEKVLQEYINEINILRQPSIRSHSAIVELQGICWEVISNKDRVSLHQEISYIPSSDGKVWPVLIFEKSELGDLWNFLTHSNGRVLKLAERYEICTQIGLALSYMQSHGIIHGDIKPGNVLMFQDDENNYQAKVHDFGYSSYSSGDEELIPIARSRPWNAPEASASEVLPADARRRDVFSFGLLCVWIFFEKVLSGNITLPEAVKWVADLPRGAEYHDSAKNKLEDLKREQKLCHFTSLMLETEADVDYNTAQSLQRFFETSLANDPLSRASDIQELLGKLKDTEQPQEVQTKFQPIVQDADFQILPSLTSLFQASYRVRSYIVECLERRALSTQIRSPRGDNVYFQLAICYKIGFGTPRDEEKSKRLLEQSSHSDSQLENVLDTIQQLTTLGTGGSIFSMLVKKGHVPLIDFSEYYREQNDLEDASIELDREISDLEAVFGKTPLIVFLLKDIKSMVLKSAGKWKESEALLSEQVEVSSRVVGRDHAATQTSLAELASLYHQQGRWNEAYELEIEVLSVREKTLGKTHPATITSMVNLGATHRALGKWNEAEQIEKQALEAREKIFGPNHPATLSSLSNLAVTVWSLGKWQDAKRLSSQALDAEKIVLGLDHPSTLNTMSNLASTHRSLGEWKEAEEMELKVMQSKRTVLGVDHPATLLSMYNLALTYQSQGRWKQAEDLNNETLSARKQILGLMHPDTWSSMESLAATYWNQGRWDEAGVLFEDVATLQGSKLGESHPDTLNSLSNLALLYHKQRLWDKAVDTRIKVLEAQKKLLGPQHPSTVTSKSNLAAIYYDQGLWNKAEILQKETLKGFMERLGETHPDTMTCMVNLAATYRKLSQHDESEKLQMVALNNRKRLLGDGHRDTIISMQNLAYTLVDLNRDQEALEMLGQSIELAIHNLGPEHYLTKAGDSALKSLRERLSLKSS